MITWKAAAIAAAGALALAGCQQATVTDSAAFEKQAKEDARKFIPALNAGDVDTILAQYAPDAEVLAPGNARAIGHDAIRTLVARLSEELQAGGVSLVLNDDDKAGASGDLGWHSGSFVVKDASGNAVDSGNYLAVMRQAEGKWLMIRDTWNSDRPPPPPTAAQSASGALVPPGATADY